VVVHDNVAKPLHGTLVAPERFRFTDRRAILRNFIPSDSLRLGKLLPRRYGREPKLPFNVTYTALISVFHLSVAATVLMRLRQGTTALARASLIEIRH
jgi:hypothetical protein